MAAGGFYRSFIDQPDGSRQQLDWGAGANRVLTSSTDTQGNVTYQAVKPTETMALVPEGSNKAVNVSVNILADAIKQNEAKGLGKEAPVQVGANTFKLTFATGAPGVEGSIPGQREAALEKADQGFLNRAAAERISNPLFTKYVSQAETGDISGALKTKDELTKALGTYGMSLKTELPTPEFLRSDALAREALYTGSAVMSSDTSKLGTNLKAVSDQLGTGDFLKGIKVPWDVGNLNANTQEQLVSPNVTQDTLSQQLSVQSAMGGEKSGLTLAFVQQNWNTGYNLSRFASPTYQPSPLKPPEVNPEALQALSPVKPTSSGTKLTTFEDVVNAAKASKGESPLVSGGKLSVTVPGAETVKIEVPKTGISKEVGDLTFGITGRTDTREVSIPSTRVFQLDETSAARLNEIRKEDALSGLSGVIASSGGKDYLSLEGKPIVSDTKVILNDSNLQKLAVQSGAKEVSGEKNVFEFNEASSLALAKAIKSSTLSEVESGKVSPGRLAVSADMLSLVQKSGATEVSKGTLATEKYMFDKSREGYGIAASALGKTTDQLDSEASAISKGAKGYVYEVPIRKSDLTVDVISIVSTSPKIGDRSPVGTTSTYLTVEGGAREKYGLQQVGQIPVIGEAAKGYFETSSKLADEGLKFMQTGTEGLYKVNPIVGKGSEILSGFASMPIVLFGKAPASVFGEVSYAKETDGASLGGAGARYFGGVVNPAVQRPIETAATLFIASRLAKAQSAEAPVKGIEKIEFNPIDPNSLTGRVKAILDYRPIKVSNVQVRELFPTSQTELQVTGKTKVVGGTAQRGILVDESTAKLVAEETVSGTTITAPGQSQILTAGRELSRTTISVFGKEFKLPTTSKPIGVTESGQVVNLKVFEADKPVVTENLGAKDVGLVQANKQLTKGVIEADISSYNVPNAKFGKTVWTGGKEAVVESGAAPKVSYAYGKEAGVEIAGKPTQTGVDYSFKTAQPTVRYAGQDLSYVKGEGSFGVTPTDYLVSASGQKLAKLQVGLEPSQGYTTFSAWKAEVPGQGYGKELVRQVLNDRPDVKLIKTNRMTTEGQINLPKVLKEYGFEQVDANTFMRLQKPLPKSLTGKAASSLIQAEPGALQNDFVAGFKPNAPSSLSVRYSIGESTAVGRVSPLYEEAIPPKSFLPGTGGLIEPTGPLAGIKAIEAPAAAAKATPTWTLSEGVGYVFEGKAPTGSAAEVMRGVRDIWSQKEPGYFFSKEQAPVTTGLGSPLLGIKEIQFGTSKPTLSDAIRSTFQENVKVTRPNLGVEQIDFSKPAAPKEAVGVAPSNIEIKSNLDLLSRTGEGKLDVSKAKYTEQAQTIITPEGTQTMLSFKGEPVVRAYRFGKTTYITKVSPSGELVITDKAAKGFGQAPDVLPGEEALTPMESKLIKNIEINEPGARAVPKSPGTPFKFKAPAEPASTAPTIQDRGPFVEGTGYGLYGRENILQRQLEAAAPSKAVSTAAGGVAKSNLQAYAESLADTETLATFKTAMPKTGLLAAGALILAAPSLKSAETSPYMPAEQITKNEPKLAPPVSPISTFKVGEFEATKPGLFSTPVAKSLEGIKLELTSGGLTRAAEATRPAEAYSERATTFVEVTPIQIERIGELQRTQETQKAPERPGLQYVSPFGPTVPTVPPWSPPGLPKFTPLNLSPVSSGVGFSFAPFGSKRGRRSVYADLFSVTRSQLLYGKATHGSSARYAPYYGFEMGRIKTVEELEDPYGKGARRLPGILRMKPGSWKRLARR